jgi:hypothetical protein
LQYVNLLCAHDQTPGLREFSEAFFKACGVVNGQERESSNYVGGVYFKGSRDGAEYTVSMSDEEGNVDLPVWVQVSADMEEDGALDNAVGQVVRARLLPEGFRVARMVNFGKRGEQRIDFA